ncbi:MAG TPA: cytochrome c [Thermoanaerobaculia bacterium]|nr:cytochrome c [Thermoanaerobaculia bacterium]
MPRLQSDLCGFRKRSRAVFIAVVLAATSLSTAPSWAGSATDLPEIYSVPGGYLFDNVVQYRNDDDHFKYGSLGGERGYNAQIGFGLPYWIWVAMPELFPEYLPDKIPGQGLKAFGYIYEKGRDPRFQLPIGTSQRQNLGIDRVWINCGACHTGTVRETPESEPQIVLGMPANRYNQGAWGKFLFDCAADEKFTPDRLLFKIREMEKERRKLVSQGKLQGSYLPPELSYVDEWIFKAFVIPTMRNRLLELRSRLSYIDFTSWGPGRVDTWNTPKGLLNFPMDKAPQAEKKGNTDFPSVWHQLGRVGMQLHWDGNNDSVHERNLSASFAGTIPATLDKCSLRRIAHYLETLAPPPFPAAKIDRALAARGEPIYNRVCANCHGAPTPPFRGPGEAWKTVGTVIPLNKIGTDRWHFDSYTPELAKAQNSLYSGYPLANSRACPGDPASKDYPARFSHFRKTDGYAASPLDGIWLRAPYLHNGSVPSLRMLLEPSANRPKDFWIGYDVYDYKNVGFVTDSPEAKAQGWHYDTTQTANGNQGHEGRAYGTELSPEEKDALIEYLKTF